MTQRESFEVWWIKQNEHADTPLRIVGVHSAWGAWQAAIAQKEAQQEPAPGDIRALKHRIHELEGEVIGYKRILDGQEPVELMLTFNFGSLVKAVFQNRVLYEVDLSPKPYFQVCWASGWGGAYESKEDAKDDCLSICGYGRSIREVKPSDSEYKNPHYLELVEQRIPLYTTPPNNRAVLEMALAALEAAYSNDQPYLVKCKSAINAIREALK